MPGAKSAWDKRAQGHASERRLGLVVNQASPVVSAGVFDCADTRAGRPVLSRRPLRLFTLSRTRIAAASPCSRPPTRHRYPRELVALMKEWKVIAIPEHSPS